MLRLLGITAGILLSIGGCAQSIERNVFASTGEFFSNGNGQISFTIGEPIVELFTGIGNDLSQGFQQVELTSVNINQVSNNPILSIYPNPTKGHLTIELNAHSGSVSVQLLSLEGRTLYAKSLHYGQLNLDMKDFPNGLYILQVIKQNRVMETHKIIKTN